jgi:hypothetical protein
MDQTIVPFSAEKYRTDPNAFFAALKITKGASGYTSDIARFTDSGDVWINLKNYREEELRGGFKPELLTDIPKEVISGFSLLGLPSPTVTPAPAKAITMDAGDDGYETRLLIGLIVGGLVLVGLVVGVVVFLRLRKRPASSGSGGNREGPVAA